jgi:tellurite methyltransferase
MDYMGNSTWWNQRFANRKLMSLPHEKCIEDDLHFFKGKRSVLDLACGDGRNSIYLAKLGYDVVGVDFSNKALQRLDFFATQADVRIQTYLADLSQMEIPVDNPFDVIIVNHYRPNPNTYCRLAKYLNPDGLLWINGFSEVSTDNPQVTRKDLICEKDFFQLDELKFLDRKHYEENGRKFVRFLWQAR